MRRKILIVTAAVIAAIIAVAVALGSHSPHSQLVRGQILGGSPAAATALGALGGVQGICAGAVEGTQVIVKGPSGDMLATTNLTRDAKASAGLGKGLPADAALGIYDFAATIPAGSGPYTIDVVGVSSLVVAARNLGHLSLTC